MKKEIKQHIIRSEKLIIVTRDLIELGHWEDAVSRAYYSMFHAATAVLLSKNIQRSSHHALISAFGEYVTKPGLMDRKLHQYLITAFSVRSGSDYMPIPDTNEEDDRIVLDQAQEFLGAAKDFLRIQ